MRERGKGGVPSQSRPLSPPLLLLPPTGLKRTPPTVKGQPFLLSATKHTSPEESRGKPARRRVLKSSALSGEGGGGGAFLNSFFSLVPPHSERREGGGRPSLAPHCGKERETHSPFGQGCQPLGTKKCPILHEKHAPNWDFTTKRHPKKIPGRQKYGLLCFVNKRK